MQLRSGDELPHLATAPYSQSLKNLIQRMMAKYPHQRPTAKEILENYLESDKDLEKKWLKIHKRLLNFKLEEYKALKEEKERISVNTNN